MLCPFLLISISNHVQFKQFKTLQLIRVKILNAEREGIFSCQLRKISNK